MSDDIDMIRKELEEVRRLKEELRREVDVARRDRDDQRRLRAETKHGTRIRPPRPPKPPKPPHRTRMTRIDLDLEDLTDSLETMMDGLGHSIEMSLRGTDGLKVPGIRIHDGYRRTRRRKDQRREIESIAPERVSAIVAPLGSEERLKILDYLKTGGKSFNDLENFTGKTGSSLTHHLNPLIDAGYVVKGEVRGTYYVTVEGRLAYRLAQWLTHRIEKQRQKTGSIGNDESSVDVEFDDTDDTSSVLEDETAVEEAEEHLEQLAEEFDDVQDQLEDEREELEEAEDLDTLDWED
ncbi:MAG: ArsR/SmtB family transcription factor [Candidatus Sifarchaeia archaeon]